MGKTVKDQRRVSAHDIPRRRRAALTTERIREAARLRKAEHIVNPFFYGRDY